MITPSPEFVSTDLGRLHVRRTGTGPPVVLWHSLFVDSRSWGPLIDELAGQRTVYAIDGPSPRQERSRAKGFHVRRSGGRPPNRRWTGWASPSRWTGWATPGADMSVSASRPGTRLRTLTTIGTPVQGFTLREKLTKAWPLVGMYRLTGPNGFIVKQLFDSLSAGSPRRTA